jgi:glycosyltransferase involved in cell wall biosynthesis
MRVVIVQTTATPTAETRVLRTLVTSLGQWERPPETLLLQGVGPTVRGRAVAASFRGIPGVSMVEVPVGSLGSVGTDASSRRAKATSLVRLLQATPELVASARRFQPNVVYSAQQKWDLRVAAPLARLLRLPHVVHLHYRVGPWLGKGSRLALERARVVICVSEFLKQHAQEALPRGSFRTLHNTMSVPQAEPAAARFQNRGEVRGELGLPDESILVGMVARLSIEKGQQELLEAMVPILRRQPAVHLVLAGQEYPAGNGLTDRLRSSARSAGIGSQCHVLGGREDVPRLLSSFDIFAHPSRQEPCSLAVLEAMASGLPVVGLREGAMPEQIVEGMTGLLVAPGNCGELTAALDQLLANPRRRRTFGERAKELVAREFNPDAKARQFADLLAEAAGLGLADLRATVYEQGASA